MTLDTVGLDEAAQLLAGLSAEARPWLQAHGVPGVFVALFLETLLFAGVIFPGYGVLLVAGYLAGTGLMPFTLTFLAACSGAVAGDLASFALGSLLGQRLTLLRSEQALRVRKLLDEETVWILLAYHHVPTLRALVPVVAGGAGVRPSRWLLYDLPGACLWVTTALGLGYGLASALHGAGSWVARFCACVSTALLVAATWRMARRFDARASTVPDANR